MITIRRIEIVNFRSIPYALITPAIDGGMTALAGANGTGKSSSVHALLWAMWGTTPADVSVRGLRRQGSEGAECRVTVEFTHQGQVIEMTRALKGRNDTTVAYVKVDGVEMTNVSAKTAVTWLEQRLGGLDAVGFLTAFVVRQKEMDDLVRARPAERKRLIERLAGIERMSDAVKAARENENDAKRVAALLPGSQQALDDATAAFKTAQDAEQVAEEALKSAERTAETAGAESARATATYQAAAEQAQAHRELETKLVAARADATVATAAKQTAAATLESIQTAAAGGDAHTVQIAADALNTATEALRAAREAAQAAAGAEGVLEGLQRALTAAEHAVTAAARERDDMAATVQDTLHAITANPAPTPELVAAAESEVAAAGRERAELQAEYKRLTAAITTLTEAHSPTCPTCTQSLTDPAALVASLSTAKQLVTEQGVAAKTRDETANAALAELHAQARTVDGLTATLTTQQTGLTQADARLAQLTATAHEARGEFDTKRAELTNVHTAGDITDLEQAVEVARAAHTRAQQAAQAAADLTAAAQHVADTATTAQAADDVVTALTAELASLNADAESTAATALDAASAAQIAKQAADLALATAQGDASLARHTLASALTATQTEQQRMDAKASALRTQEERTATREALDAFRLDRLARIAPELAEVTTDLVARMSNGRYVAVDFDENFTPILTDNTGQTRPSAMLSGGEESIVALAMRVGIGELIAGSHGGLLVLDEVLTAQDADRRQAMIAAIRELPGRQVIMINHVAEALDIADSGYLFAVDDDGEVTVRHMTADQTVTLDAILDPDLAA